MAPLPRPFSRTAQEIEAAISEGRSLDAQDKLIAALEIGNADKATQILAARWIATVGLHSGVAKKLRDEKPALLKEWLEIAEFVEQSIESGSKYAEAIEAAQKHFGYSRRHVEDCTTEYRANRNPE